MRPTPNRFDSDEGWTFTTATPNAFVATGRKDGDYLTLGFWLVEPDNARGSYSYAPFYAGRDAFDPAHLVGLKGTATYAGPAVGKYVIRDFRSEEARKGIFTASATLTANFDPSNCRRLGPPRLNAAGAISGTVKDFKSADPDHYLGTWNVGLTSALVTVVGPAAARADTTMGWWRLQQRQCLLTLMTT